MPLPLAAEAPDLILLDINMPGEDGLSVLRGLRAREHVPVIMLTAAGEVIDRIVGLELGADDYLGKPVDLRELEAHIRAGAGRRRRSRRRAGGSASARPGSISRRRSCSTPRGARSR